MLTCLTKLVFDLTFTEIEIRTIPTVFVSRINAHEFIYLFPHLLELALLLVTFILKQTYRRGDAIDAQYLANRQV